MKRNVFVLRFILLLLFLILVSSFSFSQSKKSVTIVDLAGRKVEINLPVKRVVAIGPGALRIVSYIDQFNKIVGVENIEKRYTVGRTYNMAFFDIIEKLPIIGQGGPDTLPDPEKLISVNPDVIFVIQLLDKSGADKLYERTKVPVVVLNYGTLGTFDEDLFKSLEIIGKVLNKEARASAIITYIKNVRNSFALKTRYIQDKNKPSVYVGALGFKGARGIESTQGYFPIFTPLYIKNVADSLGKKGSIFIEKEMLLVWDPDIIFVDLGNLNLVRDDFKKNPNFYKALKAYRNRSIYGIYPYNNYNTNVDTAILDMFWVAKVVYPDKFKDLDIENKAQEIYTFFFGERGKKIYPEFVKTYGNLKEVNLEE
ncbi:iron ABC transporter substrate-binding protein [Dictyoglomus thermophilum]|uniref:ABC-type Fe3+-siderophores transport system, periplasmic component n=1 Tax=Dictyoglomus thermophilum (strain ATCC 35947 / DSM 3960 / H-6-12) TaxID=309799 RepID=B5YCC1_DICT6|nr:iron ABC transporter substrate-binding protein [Dictyoglomus thermophilum]ACI19872.1 ABC-type Fe3+-siderophores transport system, periplasmic component [Dictyoglomus thermophilum H-6-12]